MSDIETKEDVTFLVDTFYEAIKSSPIQYFFADVAKVDWEAHLPRMYSFWESIIFGKSTFTGNPMLTHMALDNLSPIKKDDFDLWLSLWNKTIDANFKGHRAEETKSRAQNIAQLMQFKIEQKNASK